MDTLLNNNINRNELCACTDVAECDLLEPGKNFELKLDDIHIWHILPGQDPSRRYNFYKDCSYIQMVFSIGSFGQPVETDRAINSFGLEQNLLLYIPRGVTHRSSQPVEINYQQELFGINISSDLFFKVLPENGSFFNAIRSKIQDSKSEIINSRNLPVTIDMREVIHQIMRCMRKDHCRCIYYQAKVMELLSLQLEQMESSASSQTNRKLALKDDELKRIYRVKDILEQNPEESFSLLGLAHTVGTNDSTLKKHFKIAFGTTVFSYLNAYRMEKAKEMLLKQDCKISSIANQFGYKHATHFSAAFKKYFGYPPTKIKG